MFYRPSGWIYKLIFILAGSVFLLFFPNQKIDIDNNLFRDKTVVKVIDGDTIELSNGERVRYIGIDTPEIDYKNKKTQCFAKKAKEENKKLVLSKQVRLEKDVSDKDKYGRLLRYVFVKDKKGGEIFVNLYLIKHGYALIATYPPDVKYYSLFLKAQQEARKEKRGLWKECGQ